MTETGANMSVDQPSTGQSMPRSSSPIPPARIQVNNRKVCEGFYRGLGLEDIDDALGEQRDLGLGRTGVG